MREFLGVIADDLTGACDVGAQFRKHGLKTVILIDSRSVTDLKSAFDVIVANTETRNLPPQDAYRGVRETVRLLQQNNVRIVYKKIDSTLRGNVGTEIAAVLDELNIDAALITPAFPSQKRTVINGRLLVDGIPIEKTEYAYDPLSPIDVSRISALMKREIGEEIGEITLHKIRRDVNSIVEEARRIIKKGIRIIVADAELQSDLERIAKASAFLDNILLCGSAGLASAYAYQLAVQPRILIVSGSVNSVTLDQIEMVIKKINAGVIEPDLHEIIRNTDKLDDASNNLAEQARKIIDEEKDIIIRLARSKSLILEIQKAGYNLGMDKLEVANLLLSVLSRAVKKILSMYNFDKLILIGGDTSIKVLNALGAKEVAIEGEVLPGIPIGRIIGGEWDGMKIITKAGGFGDRYTLVRIIKSIRKQ